MKDLKFRVWIIEECRMCRVDEIGIKEGWVEIQGGLKPHFFEHIKLMQYTGLKDKNGVDYVYEGDIVTEEGLVRGNIHEIQPRDSDIVIPRIASKDWQATYKIAMDRGLIHT